MMRVPAMSGTCVARVAKPPGFARLFLNKSLLR